jgi:hypothetical protein
MRGQQMQQVAAALDTTSAGMAMLPPVSPADPITVGASLLAIFGAFIASKLAPTFRAYCVNMRNCAPGAVF